MNAQNMKLRDFFDGAKTFTIPVYQRKYDWQTEHCQQFFSDLEKIISSGREHFLGTFVYQKKSAADGLDEHIIIDGQQRITSIILLAKALYELAEDETLKEEISDYFIKNSKGRRKNKSKLNPTEYDAAVFEKLMNYETFDENNFSDDEKFSVTCKNFLFFRQKISGANYSAEEIYNAMSQLNIVGILLENENPQEIFESLNSTGKDLTEADLIRNYLLMPLEYETQEELYKKYWLEIEKLLRTSDNVENFVLQYLITKRRSDSITKNEKNIRLSRNNLYDSFKEYFEENYLAQNRSVEEFLQDIHRYAKFYRRFIFTDTVDDFNFNKLSALEKKFCELTYFLEASNAPIILMYLYDKYEQKIFDEQTFMKFLDAMISLAFRAKVCRRYGLSQQFAGNVIARLDGEKILDENTFWSVITFGKGKYAFPSDEEFRQSLQTEALYLTLRGGCKYLLYSLEKNSALPKELPSYFDEKISVEHILPQKLNKHWKNYLESKNDLQAHEILVHTLGNLTLTAYNSELSNSDFESKKNFYAESGFFYTRELKNYSDWTSNQIRARSNKLAKRALDIWTLPETYNSVTLNFGNTYNLEEDSGVFTGTKPEKVSIANVEVEVRYWIDILRDVAVALYTLDKDSFRQAAQMENIPMRNSLFTTEKKNKSFKIDENYFLTGIYNAKTCLRITKILAENFDSIAGTNIKDEIWFTLKK